MTTSIAFGLRIVLAAVFGFAGLAKAADLPGSRKATADFGLPPRLASYFGNLLPAAEVTVAALLIPGFTARPAGVAAIVLLIAFLLAIAFNLLHGRRPECRCFGRLRAEPIGWSAVVRNTVLLLGAAWLVVSAPPESFGDNAVTGLARAVGVSGTMTMVAAISIALSAQTLFVWQLFRQQGRLLVRIEDLERRLGGADASEGLPVGATAPRFDVLAKFLDRRVAVLLLFTDPQCGPCMSLWPTIAKWQQERTPGLTVAVVSQGNVDANRAMVERYDLTNVVVQRGKEITDAYRVAGTPAGVLVLDDGQIGSPVALGPHAITSLWTTALALASSAGSSTFGDATASDLEGTRYGEAVR